MGPVRLVDAADVRRLLPPKEAVAALERALVAGLDIEADSPRLFSPARSGEFLLMPAASATGAGVKVLTLAPDNPAKGLPKIQGHYLLFSGEDLAPRAIIDGAALTLARTPAMTTMVVQAVHPDPIPHLLVYGTGPQARAHVEHLAECVGLSAVSIAGRTSARAAVFAEQLRDQGFNASPATSRAVKTANVIVCATSSTSPLFDGAHVRDDAIVAAIGSHGLDAREVDEHLVTTSTIVVEARASALRESGNLLSARPRQWWIENPPANVADLVRGAVSRDPDRPFLYSAAGMSWEDLVLAEHLRSLLD